MSALYQPLPVQVRSIGEHVVFSVGSSSWTLHYETALLLSWWMRARAKEAKRFAGDLSRLIAVKGVMHDAERGINAGQPFTPGKVYPVNRDVLPRERIRVRAESAQVVLQFANTTMHLPYEAALTIGQWVRLGAKESKARAGDLARHWSAIGAAHDATYGQGVTRG